MHSPSDDALVLHSEEPALQSQRGGRELPELAHRLRSGFVPVVIPLWRKNLARIPALISWLREQGRALPMPEAFQPRPNHFLAEDLGAYHTYVQHLLSPHALRVAPPDQELLAIASRLDHATLVPAGDRLRLFGMITEAVFVGPRVFHLDVTNACNTNCLYCWFHSPLAGARPDAAKLDRRWRNSFLEVPVALQLLDDLRELGSVEDLVISGKGEPLLHPRILDLVSEAKDRELFVTLFTNGILLDQVLRERLLQRPPDLLYVSVSAATPATYRLLHRDCAEGEFERVRANLRALGESREQLKLATPRIVLVMVLNRYNAEELEAFYELGRELGVAFVRYQVMADEPYLREAGLLAPQLPAVLEQLAKVEKKQGEGPRLVENISLQAVRLAENQTDWSHHHFLHHPCNVGWFFARSWADGGYSFCCSPKATALGHDRSFKELWQSEHYRSFRRAGKYIPSHADFTFEDGTPLYTPICNRCPHYEQMAYFDNLARSCGLEEYLWR
ncbi:MAG: hypothetical protein A2284_17105 [Deltaproteobacteria bacterium RIFOXYA12_FULL_61_11]|nr:MAG: hypothetical protein A2284_17105 [Deltaproteobacteria bacterium RIFOXYA12_FULL_61_11]